MINREYTDDTLKKSASYSYFLFPKTDDWEANYNRTTFYTFRIM